ncbi:hypothetical protein [Streptomyces griseosporeus]|uniref:hypothetical protein n=1 Tax=Streptomyces griseosporeus TaxID=1910 RepID=UPI0037B89BB3
MGHAGGVELLRFADGVLERGGDLGDQHVGQTVPGEAGGGLKGRVVLGVFRSEQQRHGLGGLPVGPLAVEAGQVRQGLLGEQPGLVGQGLAAHQPLDEFLPRPGGGLPGPVARHDAGPLGSVALVVLFCFFGCGRILWPYAAGSAQYHTCGWVVGRQWVGVSGIAVWVSW